VDVHPPHGPIHSVRDFMVHLLAITIGLLIALGLEATVEWLHHRSLVREARENISHEIRDNRQRLATELNALPAEEKRLEDILTTVGDVERGRSAKPIGDYTWTLVRLSESAWNTAFSTGATAHMQYDQVNKDSQLYAAQQLFNSTMERYVGLRIEMYAFLTRLELPDKPSSTEFEAAKRVITSDIIMCRSLREVGNSLNEVPSLKSCLASGRYVVGVKS
jgi:hypothetical protein